MSNEIEAVINASEIESKNVEVGEWGLTFKGQLTPNEWYKVALNIQRFDGKIQWYLGDLAVYAESPTTGWGESKYNELIAGTGYEYQTLKSFAVVARRFPPVWRETLMKQGATSHHLSWNHFRNVISLEDNWASYWLEKAAKNAWGVAKLREEISKWKEGRNEVIDAEDEDGENIPTFTQQMKELATWARTYSKDNNADLIRIQIIKGGHVIDEKTTEVY